MQIATNGSNHLDRSTQDPQFYARYPQLTKQTLTLSANTSARQQQQSQVPADREHPAPQTCSLLPPQQQKPTPWPCLLHHSSTLYCLKQQPVLLLQQQLHRHCRAYLQEQPIRASPGQYGSKATTTSPVLARNSPKQQSSSSSAGGQGPSTSGDLACLC